MSFIHSPRAYATAITWSGGGTDGTCGGNPGDGNKWSCALNWSTGVVPTSADTVTFNNTSTKSATIDASFTNSISTLTIASTYTGTITMSNNLTIVSSMALAGGTFNEQVKTLSIGTSFSQTGGTFSATTGTFSTGTSFSLSAGSFTATSGTSTIGNGFTVSGTPTFSANGGTFTFSNGTLTCVSAVLPAFNSVNINNTAGTVTVGSNCTLPLGANPTLSGTAAITVNGSLSGSGTITKATGGVTMNAGAVLSGFSGLSLAGFTVSGATVDLSNYSPVSFGATLALSSGSLTIPTGTMTLTTSLTITGGTLTVPAAHTSIISITGISGTLACNNVSFSGATFSFSNTGQTTVNSTCSLPLGANPTLGGTAGVVLAGTLTGSGTMTKSSSVLTLNSGASVSSFSALSLVNLTVAGATLNLGNFSPLTISGTLTESSGTLTLPNNYTAPAFTLSGGTLTPGTGTLTLPSTVTISGTPTFSSSFSVTFSGGAATINCGSVDNFLGNLTSVSFTNNNTKTVQNCSSVSHPNGLPLGASPTISNSVSLTSSVLSGSGTLTESAGTLTLNASASLSGFTGLSLVNFTIAGATVDLSTYSSLTITGTLTESSGNLTFPSSYTAPAFTLSGGTLNPGAGTLTFSANLTVSGTPTISSNFGTITISGGVNTLNCGSVSNFLNKITAVTFTNTSTKTIQNCSFPLGSNPTIPQAIALASSTLSGTGTLTISAGGFTLNGGTDVLSGFTSLSVVSLSVNGSTIDMSGLSTVTLSSNFAVSSGSFTAPSGNLNIAGSFTLSGGTFATTSTTVIAITTNSGSQVLDCGASGTMTITSGSKFTLSQTVAGASLTINSHCSVSKPVVLGADPILAGIGSITNNGTLSGSGTLTKSSGVLTMNTGATFSGFSNTSLSSLTIAGATLDMGTFTNFSVTSILSETSGTVTASNGMSFNNLRVSGGTFNAPAGILNITGGLTLIGGTFNANSGTISLTGGVGSIACNSNSLNFVTFNNSGLKIIQPGCTVPVGSNPTLSGTGDVAVGGTLSGSGILSKSSGKLITDPGSTLSGFSSYTLRDVNINDGLIGYWPFDESSGTTSTDASPLGNTATLTGSPPFSTDVPSGVMFNDTHSIKFTGVNVGNDWGGVTSQLNDDISSNLTVSAWVKPDAVNSAEEIARTDGSNGGFFMRILLNHICFEVNNGSVHEKCGSTVLSPGVWMHVAGTYDGTTVRVYLNGVEEAEIPVSGPIVPSQFDIGIGNSSDISSFEHYSGLIDDLRLYNRTLSASEIVALAGGTQYTSSGTTQTLTQDLVAIGSLAIQPGATFDVSTSNHNVSVGGNWTNQGTFVPEAGTVNLTGSGQAIHGSTTFYNLVKTTSNADTLTFDAGSKQNIENNLNLAGSNAQLLSLRSSSMGSQWTINPAGSVTANHLDVQDSINAAASPIILAADSIDSGNNVNWHFANEETLSVNLTASATSGITSLNPTFTARASGTALGNVTYTFYCNRTDTGTNITSPYDDSITESNNAAGSSTACNYTNPGTYTAKVIAQEGSAANAQAQVTIVVASATSQSKSQTPISTTQQQQASSTNNSETSSSQNLYTVNFAVIDSNGHALPGILVKLAGTGLATLTNSQGVAEFKNVPAGNYSLTFTYQGKDYSSAVNVDGAEPIINKNFLLPTPKSKSTSIYRQFYFVVVILVMILLIMFAVRIFSVVFA